jgi:ketosteroid isomerase-like protein
VTAALPADAVRRVEAFLDAWNSHDLDRIAAVFRDDAVIDDELVVIDPDQPAGRRTYRGRDEIRQFAALAVAGFHARLVEARATDAGVAFVAMVSADALARIGIDAIEQHDVLEFDPGGDLVSTFRIGYPAHSQSRLRAARAAAEHAVEPAVEPAGQRDAGP